MNQPSPTPWTLQRIADNWHGYPNWSTFAIRSAGNLCIAVVGEVDRGTEDHNAANAILMKAAPDLLKALQHIDSNAAESVEWIRRVAREAINKATRPVFKLGDQVQNIECMWQGRVTGFRMIDDVEMLECHHVSGGRIELDDKRWFDPRDMRLVNAS